jgi:hypothetical protein
MRHYTHCDVNLLLWLCKLMCCCIARVNDVAQMRYRCISVSIYSIECLCSGLFVHVCCLYCCIGYNSLASRTTYTSASLARKCYTQRALSTAEVSHYSSANQRLSAFVLGTLHQQCTTHWPAVHCRRQTDNNQLTHAYTCQLACCECSLITAKGTVCSTLCYCVTITLHMLYQVAAEASKLVRRGAKHMIVPSSTRDVYLKALLQAARAQFKERAKLAKMRKAQVICTTNINFDCIPTVCIQACALENHTK